MNNYVLAGVGVLLAAVLQSAPSTPVPSGKYLVGATKKTLASESVLIWYPAARTTRPAEYAERQLLSKLEKDGYYEQSKDTIRSWAEVRTHAWQDAALRPGRWPLIVFLPGAGVLAFQYNSFGEELASQGYVVAVVDYFSPGAPKRSYAESDWGAMADEMARKAASVATALGSAPEFSAGIRFDQLGAAGHSIGGAAALALPRMDRRFRASVDMDGAPFGESVKGVVAPALVLRSKPVYSDADLSKRGRTREQWERIGQEAAKVWSDLAAKSQDALLRVLSIQGTGHFSFSDAPHQMPEAINRFGGQRIAPDRGHLVITQCLVEFLDAYVRGESGAQAGGRCAVFPEVMSQGSARAPN